MPLIEKCCESPKIGEEDGFYVCLNCGAVHGSIQGDLPHKFFTQEENGDIPSDLDDHEFFKDDEEEYCCDNPEMSEEDGFNVCLNCGTVYGRILDDSPQRAFTQEDIQKRKSNERVYSHNGPRTIIRGGRDARGNLISPKYKSKFNKLAKIGESSNRNDFEPYNANLEEECCESPKFGIRNGFCMCLNCGWIFTDDILAGLGKNIENIHHVEEIRRETSFGVKIDNDNIVGLGFFHCGLETFPDSFGNLLSIEELRLECNELRFLPESIGNLKSLQILILAENRLNILPESIGNLESLQDLDLDYNQLTTLPEWIGNLKSLQYMGLGKNQLAALPGTIGNLSLLKELNLEDNQLTSLPESIGNLKSLQKLWLEHNQLTSLPESIGNLKSLQVLIIKNNPLRTLPESIGNLSSLQYLWLENNQLTNLPESIGNLKSLQTLVIRNNPLRTLPESIENLKSLKEIILSSDQLTCLTESLKDRKIIKIK